MWRKRPSVQPLCTRTVPWNGSGRTSHDRDRAVRRGRARGPATPAPGAGRRPRSGDGPDCPPALIPRRTRTDMTTMPRRPTARSAGLAALLTGSVLALPDAASAHGIGGASDLPIPGWLFAWGATAVLILSFVALGVLWPKPRLEAMGRRAAFTLPRWAEPAAAVAGLALTGLVVVSALFGTTDTATNLAPTFVWVAFWVAVPLATVVLGDFYTALDPWRTIARVANFGVRAVRPYPARLGRWPAAFGLALI